MTVLPQHAHQVAAQKARRSGDEIATHAAFVVALPPLAKTYDGAYGGEALRFAYYARLSAKDKATYRKSDAIAEVPLPDLAALRPLVAGLEEALATEKRARVAKAVTALLDSLLAQLGAPLVKVHVREVRPDLEDAELHGLYTFATEDKAPKLEVWMRTRAHEKVVKFRTFLRTVVHEVLHHLDVTLFAMEDSFHTEGFFRRESNVVRALLGEEKRRPARVREGSVDVARKPAQMTLFDPPPK